MQTKGLIAALLCGTLCLTGCLKNVESESVSEVRKAKAEQLISEANLNNALAEAEGIRAKAQAAIDAAQAKLLEAQAAIANAEAARIRVEAELAEVEVELAKVKLESQKVKLQAQKARLEQTLAEVEAAIAQANLIKEQALIKLAEARMQAQIDQLKMEKDLIAAEQEIIKQARKVDEETARTLTEAWRKYADATEKYYKAIADLMDAEADYAVMENDVVNGITVLSSELQDLETYADQLLATIDYVRSYEPLTHEELDILQGGALVALEEALTEKESAMQNVDLLGKLYEEKKGMLSPVEGEDRLAYIYNWQDGFINILREQVENLGLEFVASYDEENKVPVVGVEAALPDELPLFAPLFTGTLQGRWARVVPFYGEVNEVATGEFYPAPEGGVLSHHGIPVVKAEFTPANIYKNTITALMFAAEVQASIKADREQEALAKAYNDVVKGAINRIEPNELEPLPSYETTVGLQETINAYQAIYDAMKKYVDEADAVLKPAYNAISELEDNLKSARAGVRTAVVDLIAYNTDLTDFAKYNEAQIATGIAKDNVKAAAQDVRAAARKVNNIHRALYGQIEGEDFVMPDPEDDDFFPEYREFMTEEGLLTQQAAIKASVAAQQVVVEEALAKVTPAIITAFENAKAALDNQVEVVIPDKYEKERAAWNAYQAAFAAWAINPTEATEEALKLKEIDYYGIQTAGGSGSLLVKGALEELKEAIAETQSTEAGDKTLKDKLNKAKKDYDEVNDPYEAELFILETLMKVEASIDAAVEEAQAALTLAQEGLVFAKSALEGTVEILKEAKEAEKDAYDKIKWIENPSLDNIPEEEAVLIGNLVAAIANAAIAEGSLDEAWEIYNNLYEAYNKFVIPGEEPGDDIVINLYELYNEQLDPNYASLSRRDRPSDVDEWGWHEPVYSQTEGKEPSIAQKLNNAKKHLATVENAYKIMSDAIADEFDRATEDITTLLNNVGKYDSVRSDYIAFGAAVEADYEAYMEAQEAVVDANIAIDEAEAILDAIHYIHDRVIYVGVEVVPGLEGQTVIMPKTYTIDDIEDYVVYLQTGKYYDEEGNPQVDKEFLSLNECYEMMEALEKQIAKFFVSDEVNMQKLAELEGKIEALEKKIEVYAALMELYANQIDNLTVVE